MHESIKITNPYISVIITAYNRELFISDAIESVLNSNFKDYELIIVDDCSTDNTWNIILKYKTHPKVKIFKNIKNLGQFGNRNFAASLSSGVYIKYLDSDDIMYPHCLDVMANVTKGFPEAGLAISYNKIDDAVPYPNRLSSEDSYLASFLKGGFPHTGPSAAIIKREVFQQLGGFPYPYYVGSDSIFWLAIAAKYPIIKLPPALVWYRQHEGQEFQFGIQNYDYLINDFKWCLKLLEAADCPLRDKDQFLATKQLKKRFLRNLLNLALKSRKPRKAYEIFKNSKLLISDFKYL